MADFNVSVASYSFHKMIQDKKMDVFSYLDLLKYRYHVDYADIWTEGCLKSLDPDYIKTIKAHMDHHGLKLANLCVDGPYVWCDDPEERAQHKVQMLEMLEVARILDAQTVRIDFGFGGDGIASGFGINGKPKEAVYTMTEEAFDYLVKTYKEYCGIVSQWGAKIGPENHWGWDRVPEYLINVHKAVDDPAYGHLYHLGNFYDNAEAGEAHCIANAMHTHIHAGSIPTAKEVIRRLALSDYKGCYGVEHHSAQYETERVEWQLGSLRALIAEVKDSDLTVPAEPDYMAKEIYGK